MKYSSMRYRRVNGLDVNLPLNYKNIWADRMPDIKILILHMGTKDIAEHYKTKVGNLTLAMSYHGVSANVERHKNKLRLGINK